MKLTTRMRMSERMKATPRTRRLRAGDEVYWNGIFPDKGAKGIVVEGERPGDSRIKVSWDDGRDSWEWIKYVGLTGDLR